MTLYCEPADPIGHCVRIVLAEKDIKVDINYADADNRPEDLLVLNPYNKVLTLLDRELVLYDAQIMMEYLDERFPHPPLMPVDPVARATNRQVRQRVMYDLYSLIEALISKNEVNAGNARQAMRDHLTAITPAFAQCPYFMSDDYTLIDCCMAPLLWRLDVFGVKLRAEAKPLIRYAERLFKRGAFRQSLSPIEREMAVN
jgi:RNA polymerase-associated protein